MLVSRSHADPAPRVGAGCSSLGLMGEPVLSVSLIGIGLCRVPKWIRLRVKLRRDRRALIFDSLILDFVITTEFIEIQNVK